MANIGGVQFYPTQKSAIDANPNKSQGYIVKWGKHKFRKFSTRDDMISWYTARLAVSRERKTSFQSLEVIYEGQRCGFYADIEAYIYAIAADSSIDIESLKRDIIAGTQTAYAARGLDPNSLVWMENHRESKGKYKISFHVIGRDVDFEGTSRESSLCHTAKINRDLKYIATKYPDVEFSLCNFTDTRDNILDLGVYSNNRATRTIYSSKRILQ